MRIFFIILFLLATLPMILTGVFQVGAGAMMYSHTKSIHEQMKQSEDRNKPYSDELDVVGHIGDRSRVKDGYLALRQPNNIGKFRTISVTRTLSVRDFLEKGEEAPRAEYLEILLQTRAARVAEQECRLLTKSIAEKCTVRNARADVGKRGKDIQLRARYDFTQKNGVGTFDPNQPLRFVSIRETVKRKGTPSESSRKAIYKKIARLCDTLRRQEGNCGFSGLHLTSDSKRRTTTARVQLSVLQRR